MYVYYYSLRILICHSDQHALKAGFEYVVGLLPSAEPIVMCAAPIQIAIHVIFVRSSMSNIQFAALISEKVSLAPYAAQNHTRFIQLFYSSILTSH